MQSLIDFSKACGTVARGRVIIYMSLSVVSHMQVPEIVYPPRFHEGHSQSKSFDYSTLSPSVAKFLMGQADRIRQQCAMSAVKIGRELLEAKRQFIEHGRFLCWVECEVGIPARTAQAYMRVANWVSGKSAMIAHLSPTILYSLSSASTPAGFVDGILKRAENGERFRPSVVRQELKSFRLQMQQERREPEACEGDTLRHEPRREIGMATSDASDIVSELVAILSQRLSPSDFHHVREIMTCDAILSDPQLPENLSREFGRVRR